MKISLNWLKKYVKIPESVSNEELIRLIGARLVEVEGVIDESHKYDKIYVVKVESCEKIPEMSWFKWFVGRQMYMRGCLQHGLRRVQWCRRQYMRMRHL